MVVVVVQRGLQLRSMVLKSGAETRAAAFCRIFGGLSCQSRERPIRRIACEVHVQSTNQENLCTLLAEWSEVA